MRQCSLGSNAGRCAAANSDYEIALNPAGTVLEIDHGKDGKGVKWTSGAQSSVHRGDKQWGHRNAPPHQPQVATIQLGIN